MGGGDVDRSGRQCSILARLGIEREDFLVRTLEADSFEFKIGFLAIRAEGPEPTRIVDQDHRSIRLQRQRKAIIQRTNLDRVRVGPVVGCDDTHGPNSALRSPDSPRDSVEFQTLHTGGLHLPLKL